MSDTECVFCGIAAGTEPASIVHSDPHAVAFCDIEPFTPGHLLVIPRRHAAHLDEFDESTGGHVFRIAHRLARALRGSGLRCDGVNLFLADGAVAFQSVFHVHLHVIPRWRGDGLRLQARRRQPRRDQLDTTAAAVRRGLSALSSATTTPRRRP